MFALSINILYNGLKRVKDGVSLTSVNGTYELLIMKFNIKSEWTH